MCRFASQVNSPYFKVFKDIFIRKKNKNTDKKLFCSLVLQFALSTLIGKCTQQTNLGSRNVLGK